MMLLIGGFTVASCGDDYRRDLGDSFPSGGISTAGEPEGSFRAAMSSYHVAPSDIDCMVEKFGFDRSVTAATASITFSGEALDALAEECDIDISKLWYSTD